MQHENWAYYSKNKKDATTCISAMYMYLSVVAQGILHTFFEISFFFMSTVEVLYTVILIHYYLSQSCKALDFWLAIYVFINASVYVSIACDDRYVLDVPINTFHKNLCSINGAHKCKLTLMMWIVTYMQLCSCTHTSVNIISFNYGQITYRTWNKHHIDFDFITRRFWVLIWWFSNENRCRWTWKSNFLMNECVNNNIMK